MSSAIRWMRLDAGNGYGVTGQRHKPHKVTGLRQPRHPSLRQRFIKGV